MADRIIEREGDSVAGWIVAIVILAVVVIGGLLLYQRSYNAAPGVPNTGTDVNVTVPGGTDNSGGQQGTGSGNTGTGGAPSTGAGGSSY